MMSFVLEDDNQETFEFEAFGHKYVMRYPTTEEIEKAQSIELAKQLDWIYSYIKAVKEDSPSIKELLRTKSVKVLANFKNKVLEEFGML